MNYFSTQSTAAQTHPASGQHEHPTTLGERRNVDVGFKRYYDEDELDVGLGLVTDGEQPDSKEQTKVKILYCIG